MGAWDNGKSGPSYPDTTFHACCMTRKVAYGIYLPLAIGGSEETSLGRLSLTVTPGFLASSSEAPGTGLDGPLV